jgi:SIR2-like domain/NACHT domain
MAGATKTNTSEPIHKLLASARDGQLVAVIGTGISIGLTNNKIPALSWKGLIENGFAYGQKKGAIQPNQAAAWQAQLNSSDLDDLLGAAEFVSRKLGAPNGNLYARWLENVFKAVQPADTKLENAIRALHAAGVPLCTLNYDPLLERVTGLPGLTLSETNKLFEWMRRDRSAILHLHGSWDAPPTCILGIRDYETTLRDDVRGLIQRSLSSFQRLLFIGCGGTFADPNFSALIRWLREKVGTAALEHLAAVTESEVAARNADPTWHGFVEPLAYGKSHAELAGFVTKHFRPLAKQKPRPEELKPTIPSHAKLIESYRAFLLKDCGQMTIEGIRAEMDTAQRKFDLERLFVPLEVLPSPPEVPESDPQREQKLIAWREKNKKPLPFGKVLAGKQRLALLALPGSGKTLLLKRLAVAYADPARRTATSDALPDLDVLPVLIRCREWREHIHRPIPTLLRSFSDITGEASLAGLHDALLPLFKKGRILLLVDGLDEIHNAALRATFVENLEKFLSEYKLTRFVVTSREAGFSLVAPTLARFCERWRIAPLNEDAIASLCDHWHRLMVGDSPEAQKESKDVAEALLKNQALRRLAENPLLLTMLLVVKHGAGRLPPDRVSLYDRAVEVLLDTWNIKGHDPLNLKEAVPQLACLAFELMRQGKQTATEQEILSILEEARDRVAQIRRYANDTPQEFLKRVELRSSLLVQAGHQVEGKTTVPFYQFRHLTFQEYLAAVAAAEGHYLEYDKTHTVLTPIEPYLPAEAWKEVIPMAAVLAKKQAEPLMRALVEQAAGLCKKVEFKEVFEGRDEWLEDNQLPAPVSRLGQSLLEEAQAAQETLTSALQSVAFFASGCRAELDWGALARGPYGDELLHQTWLLYAPMTWPADTSLRNTLAHLLRYRRPLEYWEGPGQNELVELLMSTSPEEITRGLLTCANLTNLPRHARMPPLNRIEPHLFNDDPAIWSAAAWCWALQSFRKRSRATTAILNRLLSLWLSDAGENAAWLLPFALSTQLGLPRSSWNPMITKPQAAWIRSQARHTGSDQLLSACVVAFHSGQVWTDEELGERLTQLFRSSERSAVIGMLEQMGETGKKFLAQIGQAAPQHSHLQQFARTPDK